MTGVLALLAAVTAAGCGQADNPDVSLGSAELGGFEATGEFLTGVADRSGREPFRVEMGLGMHIDVDGEGIDVDGTIMTAESDGARLAMDVDTGALLDDMADMTGGLPREASGGDLTMQMVTDGTNVYLQTPIFALLGDELVDAGMPPSDLGPLEALVPLADDWGRIDAAALGDVSAGEVAGVAGSQAGDPRDYLESLRGATDPSNLGDDEIRGVAVRGVGASITLGDMVAAQSLDPEDYLDQIAGGLPGAPEADAEAFGAAMLDLEIPVEVWVDEAGNVRRMTLDMDLRAIVAAVAPDAVPLDVTMTITMDFFDVGDESIAVEVPTEWVDVTDAFVAVQEVLPGLAAASS